MPPLVTKHIRTRRGENVRIGPLSLVTLIVVISMAVMGVLAASTAHATATISERQAEATERLYLDESAGQEFVAGIDGVLAGVRATGGSAQDGAQAVARNLDEICQNARAAADGRVACTASVNGTTVVAEFVCEDARLLNVVVTIQNDAMYRIDSWKMTSSQQDSASAAKLWTGE